MIKEQRKYKLNKMQKFESRRKQVLENKIKNMKQLDRDNRKKQK